MFCLNNNKNIHDIVIIKITKLVLFPKLLLADEH